MTDEPTMPKPLSSTTLPPAPPGANQDQLDFLELLADLDALRDAGTTIEHIDPTQYPRKARP